MYIAKLAGNTITEGIEIDIKGINNFKFKVLEVLKDSFRVMWLSETPAGIGDKVPYSIFADIGHPVDAIEISDDIRDPNRSFLAKKLDQ